ncbi:PREDICTED: calcium-binding and coiled-coil domain-containing protein 2-like, partial [Priapulus caudatus]|uniref:Calcium-binding and coiled-coil domain-containing protein 2-like n=1 Tax=Priapulus caudatus TaxID=37621 RepID=A0ABM1EBT2_PRICU
MADGELLVKSDFGQVVFDISDTYVAGEPLDCQYKLTELITPAGGDWVGLFRVGWTNAKSFIARQGAPCIGADQCETGEKTCIVKFE